MKIFIIAFLAFLTLFGLHSHAQISIGGIPPSFVKFTDNSRTQRASIPIEVLPILDMAEIRRQDSINDQKPNIPWRFGIAREVDFGLDNSGTWDTLPDGSRIWRLELSSPGAKSINLNYDLFYMPEGAKFFVYNRKKEILGAFTSINNKIDSAFASMPVSGDVIIVEYYEPQAVLGEGKLNISNLIHGYRSIKGGNKAFNSSGFCNVNVNCPEGDPWQLEKRAVAMITTNNNTTLCTGTLLNNVRQDTTPYLLTAAHCGNVNNSIFVFDFESTVCQPSIKDSNTFSIVGSFHRAHESLGSDFQLVELSITPPDSFNVFYAGWSAENIAPLASTVIHHPSGDVKKITKDFEAAVSTYYDTPAPEHHWRIVNWDLGTTEGGSSGSALFNEEHKVVGQLHGGHANCGNDKSDWFGKFSHSWDNDPSPSKQLKYWLDPDSTGILSVGALDPNGPQYMLDAEILHIGNLPFYFCDNHLQPYLIIRNQGTDTLKNITIKYKAGSQLLDSITWNGSLPFLAIEKINLGNLQLPFGKNEFQVEILRVNGSADQNTSNNVSKKEYWVNAANRTYYLTLQTDDYGSETTWVLQDSASNDVLYKGGPYEDITGGNVYKDTFCLFDSCVKFTIKDDFGDGFSGQWGSGFYLVTDSVGDTLVFNNNFKSSSYTEVFCPQITGLDELEMNSYVFEIYPNPIRNNAFTFRSTLELNTLTLYNSQGQLIKKWNKSQLMDIELDFDQNLSPGMYLMIANATNGSLSQKKVIVQ